jgi:hypothetical protein
MDFRECFFLSTSVNKGNREARGRLRCARGGEAGQEARSYEHPECQ